MFTGQKNIRPPAGRRADLPASEMTTLDRQCFLTGQKQIHMSFFHKGGTSSNFRGIGIWKNSSLFTKKREVPLKREDLIPEKPDSEGFWPLAACWPLSVQGAKRFLKEMLWER